ncbi:MAG: ABC transporter ATP-binding protein [Alphaproteobacteria bacterium]|nr:ABC transporter ATP-binding protein [Alphaproteobacteria bacterium]
MTADAMPIEIEDVSVSYDKRQILHGPSFAVAPGEVFGLVGLNGAGKTTLIRAILGLAPCQGSIRLFGAPSTDHRARRNLVYLPEKFVPSPQLKGWEYLGLVRAAYGLALDREQAAVAARALDFDPAVLDRFVRTYSKGMAQKLGLVGTFITGLPLLILDEPMSGLDPRARVLLKDRLLACKAEGRSVFFSSHILSDIEEICDRIGVIHQGRLLWLGTPAAFVAGTGAATLERAFLTAIDRA